MDVLTDLLSRAHARGAVFAHTTLPAPWGLRFATATPLVIHTVFDGEAWLRSDPAPEDAWLRVGAGEVVLVRELSAHVMAAAPGAPCVALEDVLDDWHVAGRRYAKPGDGPATTMLCGAYGFDGSVCDTLLAALPPVVHLERPGPGLAALLGLLRDEVARDAPGAQTVLDRLLDAALVLALREHFAAAAAQAVVSALNDPEVGRALGLLHAAPARAWTVAGLAAEVGLSRAALARRFAALVGRPPLAYLTELRMGLAEERLRTSDAKLAAIAAEVGYASEFALSAAFKRHRGVPPAAVRRAARAAA